ncbi:MAG: ABC transporter substrate-binding protein [Deltaproteobacteria bacterium]|nr:ABC transporter substrate-binding protein [Deltaproteobacteria bacterium]MDZ4343072.1 ABC transporter substrate-binding protein [Candidatus Binatia bacterium]
MNRIIVFAIVSLLLAPSLAAAQEKIKFPVSASSKTLGYSPLWVASKQGFFERQGLDVQLVLVSGADKSIMALVGGSVFVGSGSIDATIGAAEQGADVVATGGVINGLTHMLMGAKKFKTYEDLRGANIGSSGLTSGTAFVLRRMMAAKGLQYPKDYQMINVGPSAQSFLALTANRVDAALIAVPLSSDAAEIGYNIIGRAAEIIPNYQLTEISTRRSWAEKNRPSMVSFMKAMVLAMRWLYDNKEPAITFLAKEMRLKPEHARKGWEYYTEQKIWNPNAEANVEGVRTVIQIMGERNLLKPPLPSPAKYLDHSYVEEALKELGRR